MVLRKAGSCLLAMVLTVALGACHHESSPSAENAADTSLAAANTKKSQETWEPSKAVTFIVPAGSAGGADQMARFMQGVIVKNNLMKQPIIVVNEAGGAGAEGFLDLKNDKNDPEKLILTLSNLFTTPLATGVPFSWKDMTPVAMLAMDEFVLWVNAASPYKTAREYLAACKTAPGKCRMGGTGSKQEDQLITAAIEKNAGVKFTYMPYKGGGDVAMQLVSQHIDSSVNNPIEAVAQWRAGKLRPLCVFDNERLPYTARLVDNLSWHDVPTCKESGLDVTYLMQRTVFMPLGVTDAQVNYYVDLFRKVRETPDWKEFMEKGAYKQVFMTGPALVRWEAQAAKAHYDMMKADGWLAPSARL